MIDIVYSQSLLVMCSLCQWTKARIMERPFSIGDSAAREKFISKVPPSFLPPFDIEGEIKFGFNLKGKH